VEQKSYRILSNRGIEWLDFTHKVLDHIEEYTVPQYGDKPNDQVEEWTVADCCTAIKKYAARIGRNSREDQDFRDCMKIAHFAQIMAGKLNDGVEPYGNE